MMLFESLIFNLLPAAVGIMAVVLVFESCWRKCPPDKLMLVSGAGKMRSVSGKMYGSGNAQKLVKETTSIVDQVASGLKDSTGIDLPSLLNGLISNPDIDAGSAENSVE